MKLPPHLARTSAAVAAAALIGGLGTDVGSRWYRHLDKPAWQPPGAAFGPAWTTPYGLVAVASARTLDRLENPAERRAFATAFATNLVLHVGWNWLFFRAHHPPGPGRDPLDGGVDPRSDTPGRPSRLHCRHDAGTANRVGRLCRCPERRHCPPHPVRTTMREGPP